MFIDVSLGKSQIEYSYMNLFLFFSPSHTCMSREEVPMLSC